MGMCVYKSVNRVCSAPRRTAEIGFFVPGFGDKGSSVCTRGQDSTAQDELWKRGGDTDGRAAAPKGVTALLLLWWALT